MPWKEIVGQSFDAASFDSYCHTLSWNQWRPQFIVVHNTAIPSFAQRPNGFTKTHINNLVSFHRDKQGWSAGPHLFIDDKQIWVFTPLVMSGVHSPSWNKIAFGIEMLGKCMEWDTHLTYLFGLSDGDGHRWSPGWQRIAAPQPPSVHRGAKSSRLMSC